MKTAIGSAEKLIKDGEAKSAQEGMTSAISSIDRAISKRVIRRNKGARLKSRLAKRLNQATPKKKKGG
jgi:small subunit ribosomal protein S20